MTDSTALTPQRSPRPADTRPRGELQAPWPKGVSGNPRGRPKGVNRVVTSMAKATRREADAIAEEYVRLATQALGEETRARVIESLLDRFGLPRQGPPAAPPVQVNTAIKLSWDGNGDSPR